MSSKPAAHNAHTIATPPKRSINDALRIAMTPTAIRVIKNSSFKKRTGKELNAESWPHALQRTGIISLDISFATMPMPPRLQWGQRSMFVFKAMNMS